MDHKLYLLKIALFDIKPEIWRRFVVPAGISLDRLHDVIQIVMGWKDYHINEFVIEGNRYTEDPETENDGAEESMFKLNDLIENKEQEFEYIYDFGDNWKHLLTLEENKYENPKLEARVECIDGQRACPPEDVGSVEGYYNFCEAINDIKHPEHKSYKEWIKDLPWYDNKFDIEKFDKSKTNREIMKYIRWSRSRYYS